MPEFRPVSSPLIAAIKRPACPNCRQHRMLLSRLEGLSGERSQTFECQKCGHTSTTVVSDDPLTSRALGWLTGELRPPT